MAIKNTNQRLFCVGDNIVIMIGDEIVETLDVDKDLFKEQVIKQIKYQRSQDKNIRPIMIFKYTVEEMYGLTFKKLNYQYEKKGIHESSFYREYLSFLSQEMDFKKRAERKRIIEENRKESVLLREYESERLWKSFEKKYRKQRSRK